MLQTNADILYHKVIVKQLHQKKNEMKKCILEGMLAVQHIRPTIIFSMIHIDNINIKIGFNRKIKIFIRRELTKKNPVHIHLFPHNSKTTIQINYYCIVMCS